MSKKIKIGHVGAGYWGKNIIRNLFDLGVLEIICDSNARNLNFVKKNYSNIKTCLDFNELLLSDSIDAITIATPAASHFTLTRQALKAGKDVFVEKPLALKVEQGEQLATLAKNRDRILMIGHVLRYHPAIMRIKELIDEGTLGRVGYCYSNRLNLGKVRKEENILWSFAPHDISIFLYFMGEPPDEIHATGHVILQPGVHDVTMTIMKWQSGVMAHIYVSWLHPFKEHRLVVVGDKAMIVFDDAQDKDQLVLYGKGIDFIKGEPVQRDGDREIVEFERKEPLKAEMEHFLNCIKNRHQPKTDANEALNVLKVLSSAQEAILKTSDVKNKTNSDSFVHSTAVVDSGASIGAGTKIWHFSHVMGGARIGKGCNLGQNVFVAPRVKIGNNVKIQNNVSIYEGVILEDDCFCGPSMVFTNVKNPRSAIPRNTSKDFLKTHIKRGATLGANCTIICGTTIGEHAFVAAGAVVTDDVHPYALVTGIPAKQIGWMCYCGHKLNDISGYLQCPQCGKRYKLKEDKQLELA